MTFLKQVFEFSKNLERGIKKLPISRTGYRFECKTLLKRGLSLEAWAAHTHPKPIRVPPWDPGGWIQLCCTNV